MRPVQVIQYFNAPPATVFNAWLDEGIIKQWLFKSNSNEITQVTIDARVGGRFSILEKAGNEYIDHFGNYLMMEPPLQLAFTLQVPHHFTGVTRVLISIEPNNTGCILTFLQTGVAPEVTERHWQQMLQRLAAILEGE